MASQSNNLINARITVLENIYFPHAFPCWAVMTKYLLQGHVSPLSVLLRYTESVQGPLSKRAIQPLSSAQLFSRCSLLTQALVVFSTQQPDDCLQKHVVINEHTNWFSTRSRTIRRWNALGNSPFCAFCSKAANVFSMRISSAMEKNKHVSKC